MPYYAAYTYLILFILTRLLKTEKCHFNANCLAFVNLAKTLWQECIADKVSKPQTMQPLRTICILKPLISPITAVTILASYLSPVFSLHFTSLSAISVVCSNMIHFSLPGSRQTHCNNKTFFAQSCKGRIKKKEKKLICSFYFNF